MLAGTPNNIHVIDYAVVPGGPVDQKRWQGVALAFMLSLGFGLGSAFFLEYLDNSVRTTGDVEKMLHLPALASIPSSAGLVRRLLPARLGALVPRRNGNGHRPELLIDADARSPLAEVYRKLRTSVLLSIPKGTPKTLLVTSSLPAEGKTTTAVNVAISLAQTGAKVIIIDADMRHPQVHNIFQTGNERGLSCILSGDMSEEEILSVIERDADTKLHLLPSGPVSPNPAELLGSDQMRRLVELLKGTYTHIVIDSPPVAFFADSVILATAVDGVLLVVHSGKSSRDVVRSSRQLLQDVSARIVGVVLNNVSTPKQDYYYYQRYYQRYYPQS
ncbi:MAG: polysaccharide biosynthesis tyrosine autokinase, partial [Pyrinomonadaceae bacterium]